MDRLTYILSLIVVGLTPLDAVTVADDLSIGRVFYLLLLFSAFFSIRYGLFSLPTGVLSRTKRCTAVCIWSNTSYWLSYCRM